MLDDDGRAHNVLNYQHRAPTIVVMDRTYHQCMAKVDLESYSIMAVQRLVNDSLWTEATDREGWSGILLERERKILHVSHKRRWWETDRWRRKVDRSIIRSHASLRMNDIHFSTKVDDVTSRAILASGSSLHLSQEGDSAPYWLGEQETRTCAADRACHVSLYIGRNTGHQYRNCSVSRY
jgi:hypothetical protein